MQAAVAPAAGADRTPRSVQERKWERPVRGRALLVIDGFHYKVLSY